jgi:hypothetical protein
MKKVLLGTTALLGTGMIAGAAQASDGIKLDVGGFFNVVYQGVFDNKSNNHFGSGRTVDRFLHNAEVHFKGETTLDNGLTVGAQIELEGEETFGTGPGGNGDQIDKAFVYWSGGFGRVQIGSQDAAIGGYCILPPGATANFSAFSPASWGGNGPISSNSACFDTEGNSQKIVYTTPNFSGFQLHVSYTPNNNAETYGQVGVNGAGTPTNPAGNATDSFSAYASYDYTGDGWGLSWAGGGSWNGKFNGAKGVSDGESQDYQTGLNLSFGNFGVGGVFEYGGTGGRDNDIWTAGGGLSYGVDAWTVGLQGSHGHFNTSPAAGQGNGGSATQNRIIATGSYAMGPGVTLDAELGYTWYHDSGAAGAARNYHAVDVAIGSAFTF